MVVYGKRIVLELRGRAHTHSREKMRGMVENLIDHLVTYVHCVTHGYLYTSHIYQVKFLRQQELVSCLRACVPFLRVVLVLGMLLLEDLYAACFLWIMLLPHLVCF